MRMKRNMTSLAVAAALALAQINPVWAEALCSLEKAAPTQETAEPAPKSTGSGIKQESADGADFLKSLNGTYIELFTGRTCLNPKFDELWKNEAAKFIDEKQAETAVKQLIGGCQGTRTGESAAEYFKKHGGMQFCCAFLQGVEKFAFSGNRIAGYDSRGKKVFAHKYHFVEKDANGSYIFESDNRQEDEFRYFWFRPDTPSETYHIEFRYGDDKRQLTQLMEGKYAYWMASGVREGHEEEWQKSIILFVKENLGTEQ